MSGLGLEPNLFSVILCLGCSYSWCFHTDYRGFARWAGPVQPESVMPGQGESALTCLANCSPACVGLDPPRRDRHPRCEMLSASNSDASGTL